MLVNGDDISIAFYLLIAGVSFAASFIGGVTGYGTGLLLPPVLLPIVGPQYVVPIISLSALLSNASRAVAFREELDRSMALLVAAVALSSCLLGAYGYTQLSGGGVTVLIGIFLILLVPIRRYMTRRHGQLGRRGLVAASSGYGFLAGGTSGSGILLLSILLAAGLHGPAVIATDATISLALGVAKVLVFQSAGALPPSAWFIAMLIGFAALPGPFLARRVSRRLSNSVHVVILDGVVIFGGILLVVQGMLTFTTGRGTS